MIKRTGKVLHRPTGRHEVEMFRALVRGDRVHVTGKKGEFTFQSAAIDDLTDEPKWINLFGPIPTRATSPAPRLSSVEIDRVQIPGPRVLARQRRLRQERQEGR